MQHERFSWIPHLVLILGCTTPFIYLCVCFRVPFIAIGLLVTLANCESFLTLLTLANILHQIFVPLSSPSSTISLTCVGVRNRQELVPIMIFPCPHWSDYWSTFNFGQRYSFFSFYHSHFSLGVMDRQGISSSVYNNNDEFDATQNSTNAKLQAQMDENKALIKSYKRSSSSSIRRSRAHASELPSPARSHRHRCHHHHEREGHELNTNNRSTTSPSPLAYSPSDFKASSPMDIRHFRPQAPQEKFPELKSATSTSY